MTSTRKREAALAVGVLVFAGASAVLVLAGVLAYTATPQRRGPV